MESAKAAGPSGFVSEIVKSASDAGINIITGLVNHTIVQRVHPSVPDVH